MSCTKVNGFDSVRYVSEHAALFQSGFYGMVKESEVTELPRRVNKVASKAMQLREISQAKEKLESVFLLNRALKVLKLMDEEKYQLREPIGFETSDNDYIKVTQFLGKVGRRQEFEELPRMLMGMGCNPNRSSKLSCLDYATQSWSFQDGISKRKEHVVADITSLLEYGARKIERSSYEILKSQIHHDCSHSPVGRYRDLVNNLKQRFEATHFEIRE